MIRLMTPIKIFPSLSSTIKNKLLKMDRKRQKNFKALRQISKRKINSSIRKCKLSTKNWLIKRKPKHKKRTWRKMRQPSNHHKYKKKLLIWPLMSTQKIKQCPKIFNRSQGRWLSSQLLLINKSRKKVRARKSVNKASINSVLIFKNK